MKHRLEWWHIVERPYCSFCASSIIELTHHVV